MRLGLVRYLNARPLDYAFQAEPTLYANVNCFPDTPAELVKRLLANDLDAALISSVECFRNSNQLDWCKSVGVASDFEVQSLIYFRKKSDSLDEPVSRLYLDNSSRTTIALLKLLYSRKFGKLPECVSLPPNQIAEAIDSNSAGLLIGDSALHTYHSPNGFHFRDLVNWWNQETNLPFVAALWAYPKKKKDLFPDEFFNNALQIGLSRLDEILSKNGQQYRHYLTKSLHYWLTEDDRQALKKFSTLLQEQNLL